MNSLTSRHAHTAPVTPPLLAFPPMPSSAAQARRSSRAANYVYPDHLREVAEQLPRTPGVYTFHGAEGGLPLYIGKSINIRTRVMDHLRTPEEASLLRQSQQITCIPMAGDLGARLLEAQMVKRQMPLYNRLLRKLPRQFSLRLYRGEISVVNSSDHDLTSAPMLYGLYSSERSAKESLRRVADDHALCYSLLGLERLPKGRPCFRSMLRQCLGACCGRETLADHELRLRGALERLEVAAWPYGGRVAIEEQGEALRQFHVLDGWSYHGSAPTLARARRMKAGTDGFDRDAYKIIKYVLDRGTAKVQSLE